MDVLVVFYPSLYLYDVLSEMYVHLSLAGTD
jgi:hypothetical protein